MADQMEATCQTDRRWRRGKLSATGPSQVVDLVAAVAAPTVKVDQFMSDQPSTDTQIQAQVADIQQAEQAVSESLAAIAAVGDQLQTTIATLEAEVANNLVSPTTLQSLKDAAAALSSVTGQSAQVEAGLQADLAADTSPPAPTTGS